MKILKEADTITLSHIDIALGEVGYTEQGDNKTKYAQELDCLPGFYNGIKNGFAWCDVFVDWCFYKAYGEQRAKKAINHNPMGAGCAFSMAAYKDVGRFFPNPREGDQIFFKNSAGNVNHTGIVWGVGEDYVYTVEGNVKNSVVKRIYSINDTAIAGYGRPDFSEGTENSGEIALCCEEIGYGEESVFVAAMQYMLEALYYDVGSWGVDGVFGADTLCALREFQRDCGISPTGRCDGETWKEIIDRYE